MTWKFDVLSSFLDRWRVANPMIDTGQFFTKINASIRAPGRKFDGVVKEDQSALDLANLFSPFITSN